MKKSCKIAGVGKQVLTVAYMLAEMRDRMYAMRRLQNLYRNFKK